MFNLRLDTVRAIHEATRSMPPIPLDDAVWPESWKRVEYKEYEHFPTHTLPPPAGPATGLMDVLRERATVRSFNVHAPLSLGTLSTFLYWSCGKKESGPEARESKRFYPSGGARYPLEVYFYHMGSDELPRGVYHYNVLHHTIERLIHVRDIERHFKSFSAYPWVHEPPLYIFITALFERNVRKYGERGYRFVLFEAGALLQNIYLVAGALSLGCSPIGSALDEKFAALCDLREDEQFLLSVVIGEPASVVRQK